MHKPFRIPHRIPGPANSLKWDMHEWQKEQTYHKNGGTCWGHGGCRAGPARPSQHMGMAAWRPVSLCNSWCEVQESYCSDYVHGGWGKPEQ